MTPLRFHSTLVELDISMGGRQFPSEPLLLLEVATPVVAVALLSALISFFSVGLQGETDVNSQLSQTSSVSQAEGHEEESEVADDDDDDDDKAEGEEQGEGDSSDEDGDDTAPPADALDVDDDTWRVGAPKSQPLGYMIPADANGGKKSKTIAFTVDFTSSESVNKANKTRRLEIWRAKKRHGLDHQLKRASTVGREYTDKNDFWIVLAHEDYALRNSGLKIPLGELANWYNEHFETEERTQASITSHMDRIEELKAMRATYGSTPAA